MSSKIKSARDFKCESKKDLVSYIDTLDLFAPDLFKIMLSKGGYL